MTAPDHPHVPSRMDVEHLEAIRSNVVSLMRAVAAAHASGPALLLDVAPQAHEGARPHFPPYVTIETLDIDSAAGCTYVADLCRTNLQIPADRFDIVICTEVLEHTLDPFAAVAELRRVTKPGGVLCLSTPFNFRIHGPLPDCWRFTEHGLRVLLRDFDILSLEALECPGRPLMPIQYTTVARKRR